MEVQTTTDLVGLKVRQGAYAHQTLEVGKLPLRQQIIHELRIQTVEPEKHDFVPAVLDLFSRRAPEYGCIQI
jgi:hypothetical protein